MSPSLVAGLWFACGIVATAVVIGAAVRMSKSDFTTLPDVRSRLRPLLALALGAAAGALDYLAVGEPWKDALLKGLLGAIVAMVGHELGVERLRGGKEIFAGTTPTNPPAEKKVVADDDEPFGPEAPTSNHRIKKP